MPVKTADLNVIGVEFAAAKANGNDRQIDDADRNVQHVKAGEAEKRAAKKRIGRLASNRKLVGPGRYAFSKKTEPFHQVKRNKGGASNGSENDKHDRLANFAAMCRGNGQHHGQTAREKNEGQKCSIDNSGV